MKPPLLTTEMPDIDALPDALSDAPTDTQQWLSALADGDTSEQPQAVQRACALWAQSAAARQRWHTYHLIGDVMRSDELATSPAKDAAFMASLRDRLAQEPVVLAPMPAMAPAAQSQARRRAWMTPAALAAGFVIVAGVWVVARLGQPGAEPTAAALLASNPTLPLTLAGTAQVVATPGTSQAVIRDARLDSYLRAHQAARGGGGAAAVPGGGLRNVDVTLPGGGDR